MQAARKGLVKDAEEDTMLPLPLPPSPLSLNPMNPFGIVTHTVAVTATLAGLGVGLALGAGALAVGTVLFRDR